MMALQARLTEREIKALTLAAHGVPADEIARHLDSDPETTCAIMNAARRKLGASTLMEALARAMRNGIVPMDTKRV